MIVVDASAVLAIYFNEPERQVFLAKITEASAALMSPVNAWEVFARTESADGPAGRAMAEQLLEALGVSVPSLGLTEVREAADAFARYGRRTPAGLNLGDCFAYALARSHDAPLLFKGEDFTKTDVRGG